MHLGHRRLVAHPEPLEVGEARLDDGAAGHRASGKTTFAKLATRLLEPGTGEVRVGGLPIGIVPEAAVYLEEDPRAGAAVRRCRHAGLADGLGARGLAAAFHRRQPAQAARQGHPLAMRRKRRPLRLRRCL